MNDLLGGPDAGEGKAVANLPKTEARTPERAPRTFSRTSPKRPHQRRTVWQHLPLFPKPGNATYAKCERAK